MKMIVIVDYGMGNLMSVKKAFEKAGGDVIVSGEVRDIENAQGVVLPGVGAFRDCIHNLERRDLIDTIIGSIKKGKPYLGICLGLQILFTESEEFGITEGFDILGGRVVKFNFKKGNGLKIPHMGWNTVKILRESPILRGVPDGSYFYFVHSYYVKVVDESVVSTTTDYGVEFVSSICRDNIMATQFHPEKSQVMGLRIIKNFIDFVNRY